MLNKKIFVIIFWFSFNAMILDENLSETKKNVFLVSMFPICHFSDVILLSIKLLDLESKGETTKSLPYYLYQRHFIFRTVKTTYLHTNHLNNGNPSESKKCFLQQHVSRPFLKMRKFLLDIRISLRFSASQTSPTITTSKKKKYSKWAIMCSFWVFSSHNENQEFAVQLCRKIIIRVSYRFFR